jgi:hypothetical protein
VEGARISIDGRSEPDWLTPHTFSDLPAGTRLISVSKEGYNATNRSASIQGGRTTSLSVALTIPSGQINIMTVPSGAEVAIDGRAMGTSPVRARLRVGQHTYIAKLSDRPPREGTFTMENGRILTKKVIWDDEVAGIVEVRTIPPGATVSADGARISDRTPSNFRLLAGHHKLIISLPGYADVQREIDVAADDSTPLKVYVSLSQP